MSAESEGAGPRIDTLRVSTYVVPTDGPESDGTFEWDKTTAVVVEAMAGGVTGLGYTYADRATAVAVHDALAPVVIGQDAFATAAVHARMVGRVRNVGRAGIASMAISAVDVAMWDLKARLLGVPLAALLGWARRAVPIYGSGGFTSYGIDRLQRQLGGWAAAGMKFVKMKIGRDPAADVERVRAARAAIGDRVALFVDANGAYSRKQALAMAARFADAGVTWFEEPVSSDDLDGLRLVRDGVGGQMDVAAGEYGYDPFYFRRMLAAGAVDVLQADGTRCGGVTGFVTAHAVADAHGLPLSAHCAPALHAQVGCALTRLRHVEYFYDHQRIEGMLFDGAPAPEDGALAPDPSRPGLGLSLKRQDAAKFAVD
ncbi:MAG TPA: enolase C-terminal domain-like protein [Polyangia bacterium]|nr:enolase C-terminal domain-like protein [Polyangia bacterium]